MAAKILTIDLKLKGKFALVTGGAGYTGYILVPEFLRAGREVTAIDNFL